MTDETNHEIQEIRPGIWGGDDGKVKEILGIKCSENWMNFDAVLRLLPLPMGESPIYSLVASEWSADQVLSFMSP